MSLFNFNLYRDENDCVSRHLGLSISFLHKDQSDTSSAGQHVKVLPVKVIRIDMIR